MSDFFRASRGRAQQVILKDGAKGCRIVGDAGGCWTESGKIVTFWD